MLPIHIIDELQALEPEDWMDMSRTELRRILHRIRKVPHYESNDRLLRFEAKALDFYATLPRTTISVTEYAVFAHLFIGVVTMIAQK